MDQFKASIERPRRDTSRTEIKLSDLCLSESEAARMHRQWRRAKRPSVRSTYLVHDREDPDNNAQRCARGWRENGEYRCVEVRYEYKEQKGWYRAEVIGYTTR